jgi:hypothetical protein
MLTASCLVACGGSESGEPDATPAAPVAPAAPSALPPIRLVRAGYGHVEGMRDNIEAMTLACRGLKHMSPDGPVQLPSDSVLAKLAVFEYEELFDGQLWAKYETYRTFLPDPNKGCQLALMVQRTVEVEKTCESRKSGWTESPEKYFQRELFGDESSDKRDITEDSSHWQSCDKKRSGAIFEGVPSESAGEASCIWIGKAIGKTLAPVFDIKPSEMEDEGAIDQCVYDKVPEYRYRGHERLVILKTRGSTLSAAGTEMGRNLGMSAYPGIWNQKLIEFSDGTPIPAARFTKAAMTEFLSLPSATAVELP